jgi:hypothetical protein
MLKAREFDLKSGRLLTDYNPETGEQVSRTKDIQNSRLEEWIARQGLTNNQANLFTAKYYGGVEEKDIEALSLKGQEFIFSSGEYAYFAKPAFAKLLLEDKPIYHYGEASAHNAVAYGSLIISDGVAQTRTQTGKVKVLLVDNEQRSIGDKPLTDKEGAEIPAKQVEKLLYVMGDGTTLVPSATMRELLLDKEISSAIEKGLDRAGTTPEPQLVESLRLELERDGKIRLSQVSAVTGKSIETEIDRTAEKAVVQFRAALTDVPGIAKGTAKTSQWCERLGVDAIISLDDVKGAEKGGVLDRPGVVELDSNFWMNRKDIAQYGQQQVGPQVKYKIPNATLNELNPIALEKAQAVADRACDPYTLGQHKIAEVERQLKRPLFIDRSAGISEEGEAAEVDGYSSTENVAATIKMDKYGQLLQMPAIARQLNKSLRGDWKDAATTGIEIPSAMAQHHAGLKPWEVCNKDLPDGAIVAYYRSPFGNVGAAAIAINNVKAIESADPESYNKNGVAYMPPWTAKNIAITDFDSDRNGYFVGFVANDPAALIKNLREQLSGISDPAAQYEAGRNEIDRLIQQGTELKPGQYPMTVTEFVEANRPENKPLPISKDKKVLHPLLPGKTISESIAAAWIKTAQNPIGKVADRAMILESLAQHITYSEPAQHQKLLQAVVKSFGKIDPTAIPQDAELIAAGLPALNLQDRIGRVINSDINHPANSLKEATGILEDYAKYPMAKNLQTAVDIAKSNTGIIESFQDFAEKICYQEHALRRDIKSPVIFQDRPLKNNTIDPVGQQVNAVNQLYLQTPSLSIDRDNQNRGYRGFMPELHSQQQLDVVNNIVADYRNLTAELASASTRLQQKNPEDGQPKLILASTEGALVVTNLVDAQKVNYFAVVDLHDSEGKFSIIPNQQKIKGNDNAYEVRNDKNETIGFVSKESLKSSGLLDVEKRIAQSPENKADLPRSKVTTIAPYLLQNDIDKIHESLNRTLTHLKERVKGKEEIATSALLHTSTGQGIAPKIFPTEIGKHLDRVQTIDIYATSNLIAQKDALIRIDNAVVDGNVRPIASLIGNDGAVTALGITSTETPTLAPGSVVRADITAANLDPKLRLAIGSATGKAIAVAAAREPEVSSGIERDKTDGKPFGIIPPEGFAYREIPPTPEQFEFQRVNIQGKWEYEVFAKGELLGTVEKSSQARATAMIGKLVTGEYSRGQYTGRNANGGLKMNVKELVEHQPVPREMKAAVAIDKSISWGDGQSVASSSPAPQMYQPNRGELLRWYGSSTASGDSELQQVALEAGQRLAAEFKATGAVEMPPRDYSSTNVLVPEDVREQMEKIVKEQEVVVTPRFDVQVREEPEQAKSGGRGR